MITTQDVNPGLRGTMTVVGNKKFKIPATDFIISPLTADADLHLNSIVNGIENDVVVDSLSSGEYTKVTGAVPYMELYVDTDETFYIKW